MLPLKQWHPYPGQFSYLKIWPHDALRHSVASNALAHENNAPALELGHSNTQMMFQHYREVVKPKEAARYWESKPH